MRYQIRAMSFAELLDTAFRVVRDHFTLLVGLTATVQVPLAVINDRLQPTPGEIAWGSLAAAAALAFLAYPIVSTALTHAIGEIYLGRQTSIGRSLRTALAITVPLAGTMLLMYLGIIVGVLLLIIPGMYLALAWLLTTPVVVLEGLYGTRALARSRVLMRGNMLRGLGVIVLGWIIVTLLTAVLGGISNFVPLLGPLGTGIAQSIAMVYGTVVVVLIYFDARCRKEAFDLEHLAQLVEARTAQAA